VLRVIGDVRAWLCVLQRGGRGGLDGFVIRHTVSVFLFIFCISRRICGQSLTFDKQVCDLLITIHKESRCEAPPSGQIIHISSKYL